MILAARELGDQMPRIAEFSVLPCISSSTRVQRERLPRQVFPRDYKGFAARPARGNRDANDEVGILTPHLSVVVKIEVPTVVAIAVRTTRDGDAMPPFARKRHPQADSNVIVDHEVVAQVHVAGSNGQAQATKTRGNPLLGQFMLGYAIHDAFDGRAVFLFDGRHFDTRLRLS